MKREKTFFDEEEKLQKLVKLGDHLIKLNQKIDWEIFRPALDEAFAINPKGPGGRPAYDRVMMFKLIVLQRFYNISDDEMEFQINDRLSFMRFLGLELQDDVPDSKTIWLFKEVLKKKNTMRRLFREFDKHLKKKKLVGSKGTIVDASFVEVPVQRNSKDENDKIKSGETPDDWKNDKNKLSQKDVTARWAIKNKKKHFGYKNHIKIDQKSKYIEEYVVTDASVHDSQALKDLITEEDIKRKLYADSAYSGEPIKKILEEKIISDFRHEKGYRNNPLSKRSKNKNRKKSKVRARVEHVFGFMVNSMRGTNLRSIGIERADFGIGLSNLTYNLLRYARSV